MPTHTQEKPVSAKQTLAVDFTTALASGETIVGGNITVTATNALTDAAVTSVLLGSPSLSGNVISQNVQAGTLGEVYKLTFSTGTTSIGLLHQSEILLLITATPSSEIILCPRDDLKRLARVTDTTDDTLLDDLLVAASSYFRVRTGRDIDLRTYTETLQPDLKQNNVRLALWNYPVHAIDQIVLKTSMNVVVSTYTDMSIVDFLPEGYVWFNDGTVFYHYPDKNLITYRAGFIKIPEDIRECVKRLALGFYRLIGREGVSSERIGDYAWQKTVPRDLFPPRIRQEVDDTFCEGVLRRYTRHDQDVT